MASLHGFVHGARNDRWFDIWSFAHLVIGAGMGIYVEAYWALIMMIAWEPLEIMVLSPLSYRLFGIKFGYESWKNSMSDVFIDAVGVGLGAYLLRPVVDPPLVLFS